MEDLHTKLHHKDLNFTYNNRRDTECVKNVFEQIKNYAFVLVSRKMLCIFELFFLSYVGLCISQDRKIRILFSFCVTF